MRGPGAAARAGRYSRRRVRTCFPPRRRSRRGDVRVLFVLSVTAQLLVVIDREGFPVNLDMSAAPEIALLAVPVQPSIARPRNTLGGLARELRLIASHPERWWEAVRYHSDSSETITLGVFGVTAWVGVLAPGDPGLYCSCDLMMLIAGDAVEESVADGGSVTTPLQAGRMRVHGQGLVHQIRAASAGFAVTLHVRGDQPVG
jgi:hypothetical protein